MIKFRFFIIVAFFIQLIASANGYALVDAIMESDKNSVGISETFELTIKLSGSIPSGKIGTFSFEFTFPKDVVTVTDPGGIMLNSTTYNGINSNTITHANTNGKVTIGWYDINGNGIDFISGSTVATIKFTAKTVGAANLTFITSICDIADELANSVDGEYKGISVTVTANVTTTTVASTTATTTSTTAASTTTTATTTSTTAASTTTSTSAATTTTVPCSLKGDVNGDGKLNIYDALEIAKYDVGLIKTLKCQTWADFDSDGKITIFDALAIAQTLTT